MRNVVSFSDPKTTHGLPYHYNYIYTKKATNNTFKIYMKLINFIIQKTKNNLPMLPDEVGGLIGSVSVFPHFVLLFQNFL